jgi:drug/metabolite transporter (DMT)-like permease
MSLSQRNKAILQALFVTLLWSSSWVLIKLSIEEIPPLTFAAYVISSLSSSFYLA